LGFHAGNFRLRVTALLLLEKQIKIRVGTFELILRVSYLARRRRILLLQTPHSVKIALRSFTGGTRFDDLRIEGQDLFAVSAALYAAEVGVRGKNLSLGLSRLAAGFGVV
jgi:hypothetical protein